MHVLRCLWDASDLNLLADSLKQRHGLLFEIDDDVITSLCTDALSAEYGARNLRRVIQEQIELPLAELLAGSSMVGKTKLRCFLGDSRIQIVA